MKKRVKVFMKNYSLLVKIELIPKPSPKRAIFVKSPHILAKWIKIADAFPHIRDWSKLEKKQDNHILADVKTLSNWCRELWTHKN